MAGGQGCEANRRRRKVGVEHRSSGHCAGYLHRVYTEKGFLEKGVASEVHTSVGIILDNTSYYAESCGQVPDARVCVCVCVCV
jgi:alanyl-tRNA synthetase